MSIGNSKEIIKSFNETVDKFHRALSKKSEFNLALDCEYDYSHTEENPANNLWQKYVKQILELAREWKMTDDEILKIMKKEGKMTKEEYEKVAFLEFLFKGL